MNTLYTVHRCKYKHGTDIHKTSHGSANSETTICGKDITTGMWCIINNTYDGEITCKKCLSILKNRKHPF